MSNDIENRGQESTEKKRRKRRDDVSGKQPIKLVSSLGEGKLMDRFQSAVTEKEKKRKKNEKSEKIRTIQKEKRERELAKFKAEINALMEDDVQPLKPSEKMTTFVPKMTGTVKGKFEEIEKKRQEDEKKRAENERKRRNEKDLREKKRIEIELAKKKLQQGAGDEFDLVRATQEYQATFVQQIINGDAADFIVPQPRKLSIDFETMVKEKERRRIFNEVENRKKALESERIKLSLDVKKEEGAEENCDAAKTVRRNETRPGKLNSSSFEEMAKLKDEMKRKKAETERKLKMEAERRAFKEMNDQNEVESDDLTIEEIAEKPQRVTPRRLTTKFDEIARVREEEQRREADEERKRRLEEEKRSFRAAKMAAGDEKSDTEEDENASSGSLARKPSRLSSSFTKFDVLEKKRVEEERKRIQERRKKLLEEEMKIFEESKKNFRAGEESSSDDDEQKNKRNTRRLPRRLNSSFTKFDIMTQQKLQEKRERIQEERNKLLEDEKIMFAQQRQSMGTKAGDYSSGSGTSNTSRSDSGSEVRQSEKDERKTNEKRKKLTKRRKKPRSDEGKPSKLDRSKLRFDVLERQRMEKERWQIQEQRRQLLEEEKRIFEEARKQRIRSEETDFTERNENEKQESTSPSKLDYAKTRFDIMAQHRMEEERKRIREERSRLLKEENQLFEEERNKMKISEDEGGCQEETSLRSEKQYKKPSRLDKSFTEFDILSNKRKEEERARIMQESKRKLEQEKLMFREAKKKMEEDEESDAPEHNVETTRQPQKLSKAFTDFDTIARKRMEDERQAAYEEKLQQLAEEKKSFAEAKLLLKGEESDDSDSSNVKKERESFCPNRLSSKLSNFEEIEKERIEKERIEAQKRKIFEMEEELKKFHEERKHMNDSDKEEKSEIPSPQVKQPRPKKLSSSLTKFDEFEKRRQEEERRRMREQKERELAEERKRFRESREASNVSFCSDEEKEEAPLHRPISKLNVRQQMEAVLQAQREVEQKKIMETKFCRMTVEQQEMYLAKEKQLRLLQEKLAHAQAQYDDDYASCSFEEDSEEEESSGEYEYYYENDDQEENSTLIEESSNRIDEEEEEDYDEEAGESEEKDSDSDEENEIVSRTSVRDDVSTPGSNDSGYTGAPWFTETLTNVTLNEGDPVRFDAVIHADPHPKVTWYFRNRVIRNSPDYQYINKGTQYSLYMNESFVDDAGEYMCKAENSKGVATSKAILNVIEHDD